LLRESYTTILIQGSSEDQYDPPSPAAGALTPKDAPEALASGAVGVVFYSPPPFLFITEGKKHAPLPHLKGWASLVNPFNNVPTIDAIGPRLRFKRAWLMTGRWATDVGHGGEVDSGGGAGQRGVDCGR